MKKRLLQKCLFCNYCKTLKTTFFIEHIWWLLLLFTLMSHSQKSATFRFDKSAKNVKNNGSKNGEKPF